MEGNFSNNCLVCDLIKKYRWRGQYKLGMGRNHGLPYYALIFIFNWRIIALQCCVGFCHTAV